MKVRDLIEMLNEQDPNLEVLREYSDIQVKCKDCGYVTTFKGIGKIVGVRRQEVPPVTRGVSIVIS